MTASASQIKYSQAEQKIFLTINVSWIIIDSVLVLRYKHGEFSIMYFPTTNLRDQFVFFDDNGDYMSIKNIRDAIVHNKK